MTGVGTVVWAPHAFEATGNGRCAVCCARRRGHPDAAAQLAHERRYPWPDGSRCEHVDPELGRCTDQPGHVARETPHVVLPLDVLNPPTLD